MRRGVLSSCVRRHGRLRGVHGGHTPGADRDRPLVGPEFTVPKLDVSKLVPTYTGLPRSKPFAAERSGEADLSWLAASPQLSARLRALDFVPPEEDFWASASGEALETIARASSYFDVLHLAATHHWPHLLVDAMLRPDAPLPHILYEDFMKVLAFSAKQDDPMKQFTLDPALLRALLCRAASEILGCRDYFATVEALFRQIEQQQAASEEAYSAFAMCCLAADRVQLAMQTLCDMDQRRMRFDPVVFSLAMHPGVTSTDLIQGEFADKAQGLLLQQRLATGLNAAHGASAAGVHAAFVLYSLTHRHDKKWEVVREAVGAGVELSARTLALLGEVFEAEKGRFCGPLTSKALAVAFAREGRIDRVAAVLLAMRVNEGRRGQARTEFSADEQRQLVEICLRRNEADTRKHRELLFRLVMDEKAPAAAQGLPLAFDFAPGVTPAKGGVETAPIHAAPSPKDGRGEAASEDFTWPVSRAKGRAPPAEGGHEDASAHPAELVVRDAESAAAAPADPAPPSPAESPPELPLETSLIRAAQQHGKQKRSTRTTKKRRSSSSNGAPLPFASRSAYETSATTLAVGVPDDRVAVRGTNQDHAAAVRRRLEAAEREAADAQGSQAFREAAMRRAVARAELHTMRQRLSTAWMNPDLLYDN